MKKIALTTSFITAALIATTAFAQMGPGMGGPGMGGQGMGGQGMGGQGMGGQGMGGQGRFAFDRGNVYGWQLMSAEEQNAHRTKMFSMKTMDECQAYTVEHHAAMEARAKEKGATLPAPRSNSCNRMQARGMLK
ncbi:MAG: hypothetical protein HYU74_09685 [Dechloromonas sp.]|nr:hypothetical protein [Dechloromonas sp.]